MNAAEKLSAVVLTNKVALQVLRDRFGPAVRLPDATTVPPSAEALTADWLSSVLCGSSPGSRVIDFRIVLGHDGTSCRRAIALTYNDAGQVAGLPTHLFTKSAASFFSRLLLGLTEIADGEALFYNRIRPTLDVRGPKAYYAGYDPRTYRSLLVLEDLSRVGWTFPDPMTNRVSRQNAEDMVEEMAAYHGALWNSPRFETDLGSLRPALAWQQNLNRKVGFEKRTLKGLERAREVLPADLYARRRELYPAFMRSLELHQSAPQTLLHQDVHLGNWLRDPHGRMGLYDWQCVGRGHWALDYSYALAGALATDDRRAWEKDLLSHYLERLKAVGVAEPPSFDQAWLSYRQQALHAFVFGVYTLGGHRFERDLQPKAYTLAAIERIGQHVADLETLDAL